MKQRKRRNGNGPRHNNDEVHHVPGVAKIGSPVQYEPKSNDFKRRLDAEDA